MPYYFYEPVFRALMKMAVKEDYEGMNLNRLVLRIVLERLQAEGMFKLSKEQCPHDTLYRSRNRKMVMCEDCGYILTFNGDSDVVQYLVKKKREILEQKGTVVVDRELEEL